MPVYGAGLNRRTGRYGRKRPPKNFVSAYVGTKHAGVANLRNIHTGEKILVNADRYPSVGRYQTKGFREGLDALTKVLSDAYREHGLHMTEQGPAILYNAILPTFQKSTVYCPKDTLALVGTAELTIVERGKGGVSTVEIAYGRTGRVWYAAFVHEIRRYKHAAPTRYKFLESAIKEDMGALPERLAAEARRAAGGGAV